MPPKKPKPKGRRPSISRPTIEQSVAGSLDDAVCSQVQIADLLGLTPQAINKYIRGERDVKIFADCLAPDGRSLYLGKCVKAYIAGKAGGTVSLADKLMEARTALLIQRHASERAKLKRATIAAVLDCFRAATNRWRFAVRRLPADAQRLLAPIVDDLADGVERIDPKIAYQNIVDPASDGDIEEEMDALTDPDAGLSPIE